MSPRAQRRTLTLAEPVMIRWLSDPGGPLADPWALASVAVLGATGAYFVGRWLFDPKRPEPPSGTEEAGVPMRSAGARADRRVCPRRGGNAVQVQLRLDQDHEPFAGLVLNRSAGGLGILSDRAVPVQAILQVRPDRGKVVQWADAVVRSCRQEGEQFEVGLEFLGKPAWGYMMQFG
jgi:hypothetical protein